MIPSELEFPSVGYMEEEVLRICNVLASPLRSREKRCGMDVVMTYPLEIRSAG